MRKIRFTLETVKRNRVPELPDKVVLLAYFQAELIHDKGLPDHWVQNRFTPSRVVSVCSGKTECWITMVVDDLAADIAEEYCDGVTFE